MEFPRYNTVIIKYVLRCVMWLTFLLFLSNLHWNTHKSWYRSVLNAISKNRRCVSNSNFKRDRDRQRETDRQTDRDRDREREGGRRKFIFNLNMILSKKKKDGSNAPWYLPHIQMFWKYIITSLHLWSTKKRMKERAHGRTRSFLYSWDIQYIYIYIPYYPVSVQGQ